jgi:hypothetical protein
MPEPLFESIRRACAAVADRATHVRIDPDRASEYARSLPLAEAHAPSLDPKHHYLGSPDETVAFVLTLDTINFGSGFFPHLRKRPGLSGYFTVATTLKEHFDRAGPFSARELYQLRQADCVRLFDQDPANEPAGELMGLFAQALNAVGRYLLDRFEGHFTRLVEAADHSAGRLAVILAEMPFFNDVEQYGDLAVPFYKRAQITSADLNLALQGDGLGRFDDLDRLTIFADNLVPHVLRVDGVLRYDEQLAARIDAEQLIPAHSPEEIEIRACALHAVELMVQTVRDAGERITASGLDYLLWNRGQRPEYKARPRHRARTVFY